MTGPSLSNRLKFSARTRVVLGLGPLVALALVVFQNCSDISLNWQKTSGTSSAEAATDKAPTISSNQTNDGNGHGYDGKPYILIDLSGTCDSNIRAKIYYQGGVGLLVRDNCVDIVPRTLARGSFSILALGSDSVLQYLGQIFQPQLSDKSPTPTPTPAPSANVFRSCTDGTSQLVGPRRIANADILVSPGAIYGNLHLKITNLDNPQLDEDLNYAVRTGSDPDFFVTEIPTPEHGFLSLQITNLNGVMKLDSSRNSGLQNETFAFTKCFNR